MLPSTPVIIGAAAVTERSDDPTECLEAVDLMVEAVRRAAADSGAPSCLTRIDEVLVPRGTWSYGDAPAEVARLVGSPDAHGLLSELGALQSSLLHRAFDDVARGRADVVAVVGAEARYRALRAAAAGLDLVERDLPGHPDERIEPAELVISRLEIDRGLVSAVQHYALLENAVRAADRQSANEHTAEIAELWSRFNRVAADVPEAWNREPMTAAQIREPGPGNRPLASPYNKWHNSQWNVNQGAAIIVASAAAADALGVSLDRRVFPVAGADSDAVVPVTERAALHRCVGARLVARSALEHAGLGVDALVGIDLYSCFPVAVRLQSREIGLEPGSTPTITGGMSFYGGPFNNYVLASTAMMVERVRRLGGPGAVSAISGMLTKQGFTVLDAAPSTTWRCRDVSADAVAATGRISAAACESGRGTIATATQLYGRGGLERTVAVVDLDDSTRTLVDVAETSESPELDLTGVRVAVRGQVARYE